ncbi:MAG: radical SAM protein [Acidobacteria bacterium]|nr:radical SAM protein [Acidobacteriota bacterium]
MTGMTRLLAAATRQLVPITVLWELTNRCNEDCRHCYANLTDTEGELDTAEVLRVLEQLKECGTLFLTLTGGEVFVRRDLLEIVRHARELGFALRLFTNGTLVRERHARALAEAGVVAIELSLYAMDPEVHDEVTRRPGSLARTLRGARLLREHGIHVVVKAPIMSETVDEYRRVIDFAREIGADYRFDPTLTVRYDLDDTPLGLRMRRADLLRVCVDPDMGLAVEPGSGSAPEPDQAICATARRVALISARGLVYPCSQRFPAAGDLRRQSFREIWETAPLLMRLRNITARDLDGCSSCGNFSFCGRCSLDALAENGDFWGPNGWACTQAEVRQEAFAAGGRTAEDLAREKFGGQRTSCDL